MGSLGGYAKDPETGKLEKADEPPKRNDTSLISLIAAVSYGFASLAMVFLNKAVLMEYPYSMSLLTLQQVATVLLLHLGGSFGISQTPQFSLKIARKLLPLSFFYNANVAFALASLQGVNIPMYIALKRLTPLAVLVTDIFTGKGKPATQVALSVMTTGFGVLIAALGDFSFDLVGYALALTSVSFQTAYLVLVERSGGEDGMSSTELMYYNALLSLPFLAVLIIFTGEAGTAPRLLFYKIQSIYFFVIVALSLIMGIVLNYTMFLCTIVNSALTTTIVGVLKGVGSTLLGFIVLGGVEVHALNVAGLVINTAGGVWYSVAKLKRRKSKSSKSMQEKPLIQIGSTK
ncbi:hypothetical protein SELMODRAFT_179881 [Selaginella moellendorffii]|uniref:Sugar phosphate transporter domain-containing protein n=1 Tax=Selaginella moellendorffii TaxID=88036 RepID=D8SI04_SELML|nr:UDP-galactose/UDP-glucose transporter 7 [Selaginella moellendorffii]EFJ15785.1 hypothetical protein SELMODRAFT_179881 [Selaginella moellendorffii]|eukprot:XP_002982976.1 UDP-galactose/UDP-glucose transporter 7 [Selaginella moellendorffii]